MRFTGYAALFDVADRGGDVIRRGAFGGAGAPIPLLWQHDPKRRIGTVEGLSEDALGLKINASIEGQSGVAAEVAAMLNEGRVSGLSFGYRVRQCRDGPPGRGGMRARELTALDLVEVSLVTHPMQPGARVLNIPPPPGEVAARSGAEGDRRSTNPDSVLATLDCRVVPKQVRSSSQ